MITKIIEYGILAILRRMPVRLMAHVMFKLRSNPDITDSWGYHIRPIHYYEPLPDFRQLRSEYLERERFSPAIDFRSEAQVQLLRRLVIKYATEIAQLAASDGAQRFDFQNSYFGTLDAAVYYALIRDQKPKTIIEIGSGYSTQIASIALQKNNALNFRLICIEPFPEARLTASSARFELVKARVQDVMLKTFEELESGDILFIDSSHIVATGSDVVFEVLEILPRLKSGVWVHVHDIFMPRDYPAEWVIERRLAFNEQYVLEGFLSFNRDYSVQLANHWLWREYPEEVRQLFDRSTVSSPPASFWMRRE